ncbi:MAG: hypothetical protein OXM03_06070 [Chloroflexota bacterium]|nr:hypothetical protein [Chloroflexota bacterium]MDE2931366.1 hypothetical protein [Chloroflexota bacterium]
MSSSGAGQDKEEREKAAGTREELDAILSARQESARSTTTNWRIC